MEMNEKDILELKKDLSARLPYGVIVVDVDAMGEPISRHYTLRNFDEDYFKNDDHPLPYLRPMSSMTEEEKAFVYNGHIEFWIKEDYCNKHYLDYRGLIPKGLALEAPEGMYKID